jgi:hypothetical protein
MRELPTKKFSRMPIFADDFNKVVEAIRELQAKHNPHGITIIPNPEEPRGFWALIGVSATDGTNRWKYAWTEYTKSTTGYGGWVAVTGGRSGTTTTDPARNFVEDMNDAAGIQGNGVNLSNLLGTFALIACPSGVLVWMNKISFVSSGTGYTEYWFSYETGVDGACP